MSQAVVSRVERIGSTTQTVTEYLAARAREDTSRNRAEVARLYAFARWPILSFRAEVEDELSWEILGPLTIAEADHWEREQDRSDGR